MLKHDNRQGKEVLKKAILTWEQSKKGTADMEEVETGVKYGLSCCAPGWGRYAEIQILTSLYRNEIQEALDHVENIPDLQYRFWVIAMTFILLWMVLTIVIKQSLA